MDYSYLTNEQLAEELEHWAKARTACNERRERHGKSPLDSSFLYEAAKRLRRHVVRVVRIERT